MGGIDTDARRGFVLMAVLLFLALIAVVLAGVTRRSAARAVEAVQAEQRLQRRWGAWSCRRVLLSRAEQILEATVDAERKPRNTYRTHLQLGNQRYDLALSDEQAAANVNLLYEQHGGSQTARAVSRLTGGSGRQALSVELKPDHRAGPSPRNRDGTEDGGDADGTAEASSLIQWNPPAFSSWHQVFARVEPSLLLRGNEELPGMLDEITCWGTGKVRVDRASDDVLRAVLGEEANLREVRERVAEDYQARAGEEGERNRKREPWRKYVTTRSACYSLALVISSPRRTWHELTVTEQDASADDNQQHYYMAW